MKVKELIEHLQKVDQDLEVVITSTITATREDVGESLCFDDVYVEDAIPNKDVEFVYTLPEYNNEPEAIKVLLIVNQ